MFFRMYISFSFVVPILIYLPTFSHRIHISTLIPSRIPAPEDQDADIQVAQLYRNQLRYNIQHVDET